MKHSKRFFTLLTAVIMTVSASGISAAALSPYYDSFSYNSDEELADAVANDFTEEVLAEVESKESAENEGVFRKTIENWQENGIYVPCIDGKPIAYRDQEGYNNITLFAKDLFSLPALYYHPVEEGLSYIVVQYPDEEISADQLAYASYDLTEEVAVNVGGKERSAVLGKNQDDERLFYHFMYEDIFVKAACAVSGDSEARELLCTLTFEKPTAELAVADAVALQKYLLCSTKLTKSQYTKLDITGDGAVDAFDLAAIKRKLIEKIPTAEVTAETRIDGTLAVTDKGWRAALSENSSYVITSAEQLDEEIVPLFREAAVRSLKKTYDEAFFADNVLLLDLKPQYGRDHYETMISDVGYVNGKLQVTYDKAYINGFVDKAILVSQVTLPKAQYKGNGAVWQEKDTEQLDFSYAFEVLESTDWVDWEQFDWGLIPEDGRMINSEEELTAYMSAFMNEEGTAHFQELYPAAFFEEKVLYIKASEMVGGSRTVWKVTKTDGVVTVDMNVSDSFGCIVETTLDLIVLDKEDAADAEIVCREFRTGTNYNCGEYQFYEFPDGRSSALLVNSYGFCEENDLVFGWTHPVGVVLHGSYTQEREIAMKSDYMPFDERYEIQKDADGNTVYAGENFEITWKTEGVTVKFRPDAGSDVFEEIEIMYDFGVNE